METRIYDWEDKDQHIEKEVDMLDVAIIGLDLAKSVFPNSRR